MKNSLVQIKKHDLKVEVLIAELLEFYENEIFPINFALKGQFERSYSKEILNSSTNYDEKGNEYEQLEICREGIYDGLPTFALHEVTRKQKHGKDIKDKAKISQEVNEAEEAARKFFNPIEQEIYRYRGQVLKDEMEFKISLDVFKDYFIDLIKDGSEMSLDVLLTLLPKIHDLRGDIGKLETLIKKLLNVEVFVEQNSIGKVELHQNDVVPLGELSLGQNAVVDANALDYAKSYTINVKQHNGSYEQSEEIKKRINFLANLSLSADTIYDIDITVIESMFILSDKPENCPILAYNTII